MNAISDLNVDLDDASVERRADLRYGAVPKINACRRRHRLAAPGARHRLGDDEGAGSLAYVHEAVLRRGGDLPRRLRGGGWRRARGYEWSAKKVDEYQYAGTHTPAAGQTSVHPRRAS